VGFRSTHQFVHFSEFEKFSMSQFKDHSKVCRSCMVILLNGMSILERYTGVAYMARLVARNGQTDMHYGPSRPGLNFAGLNLTIRFTYCIWAPQQVIFLGRSQGANPR
jgi:hypothetical protein